MRKHKNTRANSGETLVEVTASIFIFLIMLGIIQGAISYSQASLAKNKEIRRENAKIIEGLQNAATQEEMVKNMQFVATNSDLTVKGNLVFTINTSLVSKTVVYTDSKGETKSTSFYMYEAVDDGSSNNSDSDSATPDGGDGS